MQPDTGVLREHPGWAASSDCRALPEHHAAAERGPPGQPAGGADGVSPSVLHRAAGGGGDARADRVGAAGIKAVLRTQCGSELARDCGRSVTVSLTDPWLSRASPLPHFLPRAIRRYVRIPRPLTSNRVQPMYNTAVATIMKVIATLIRISDTPRMP